MASTLKDLRREAGYKSAKDFAEAIDVPSPTYSRYEQSPEKIPLKAAWSIADFLNCSIDAVVGREHIEVEQMRGEVQRAYDELSAEGRKLHDEFMAFLESRDTAAAKRAADLESARVRAMLELLETAFAAHMLETGETSDELFTSDEMRAHFERFLTDCIEGGKVAPTMKDGKGVAPLIMAEYDRAHADEAGRVNYGIIRF